MRINKKKFEALWRENDTRYQHINVLESQIVGQNFTIERLTDEVVQQTGRIKTINQFLWAERRAKQQAIANFRNVREHNAELQEQIKNMEEYINRLEELL